MTSLGFDNVGNLYVLKFFNASAIHNPTLPPETLQPSQLFKVAPDGIRTTRSGNELKLGNYLLLNDASCDVFVITINASQDHGEVLRYHTEATTGTTS